MASSLITAAGSGKKAAARKKNNKFASHVKDAPMNSVADAVGAIASDNSSIVDTTSWLLQQSSVRFGKIAAPAANAILQPGGDTMILWSTVLQLPPSHVDIEVRDAKTNFPVQTVATNIANAGFYIWNIDQHLNNVCMPCRLFIGSISDCNEIDSFQIYSDAFSFAHDESASTSESLKKKSTAATCRKQKQTNDDQLTWSASLDEETASKSSSEKNRKKQRHFKQLETQLMQMAPVPRVLGTFVTTESNPSESTNSAWLSVNTEMRINWSLYPEFTYTCIYMSAAQVRRGLRQLLRESNLTSSSLLQNGEQAGMFCVRYLLQVYFKSKIEPLVEQQIASGSYQPPASHQEVWSKLTSVWHKTEMYRLLSSLPIVSPSPPPPTPIVQVNRNLSSQMQTDRPEQASTTRKNLIHVKKQAPRQKRQKTLDEQLQSLTLADKTPDAKKGKITT